MQKIIQLFVGTLKEILWRPDEFEKFNQMSQLQNRRKLKFPLIPLISLNWYDVFTVM